MLTIKRDGVTLIQVIPDGSDYQHKQRNGIDYVVLNFPRIGTALSKIALGDTVEVYGQNYHLNKFPKRDRVGERRINLACIFEAAHYVFGRVRFMFLDISNNLKERAFTVTGDLSVFASLLILNLNRDYPGVWSLGAIEVTEPKSIPFSGVNCLEAINTLIDEFSIEFWVTDRKINLAIRNVDSGIVLGYGRNNGLTSIQENANDNATPVTRVYAYGGDKNLPEGYRNYSTTLQLDGPIELTPNPKNFPLNEDDVVFPDLFPQYIGTVSAIEDEFHFFCEALPFDVNDYLIADTKAKITFQTGNLAGYEFNIDYYNHTDKKFTILKLKTETSLDIPSPTIFASTGDLFIVTDISMPPIFIEEAEAKLLLFAKDYLDRNSKEKLSYSVTPDQKFFKDKKIVLNVGTQVRLVDAGFDVDRLINIQSVKRLISNEWAYEVELADQPTISLATKLIRQQIKNANDIKPPAPIQVPKVFIYEHKQSFIKSCVAPEVGTSVEFKKKYISGVSLDDAISISNTDNAVFLAEGQANAESVGVCKLPKPLKYISILAMQKNGANVLVRVVSEEIVSADIKVNFIVGGFPSGIQQIGSATILAGQDRAAGVTNGSPFDFGDSFEGTIQGLIPMEDANYRYEFT